MERRQFVRMGMVGAAAGIIVPATANARVMDAGAAEGAFYYTKEKPGRWEAKVAGHAPVVQTNGSIVTVTTPHEMNGIEHYIVKHTLFDSNMKVIQENMFDPMKDKSAISKFDLQQYRGAAYALSMCNKHDCWVTAFSL